MNWILVALLTFLPPISSFGALIFVPRQQETIQGAVNAAQNGDTVLVFPGIYQENVEFQGRRILLLGVGGPRLTIINGNGEGACIWIHRGEGSGSIVAGFTLTGGVAGGEGYGGGMLIERASPIVVGNIFQGNTAQQGGGGLSASAVPALPVIFKNLFDNNETPGGGGGISLYQCGGVILNNTIVNNRASADGGGINIPFTAGVVLKNNIVVGNSCPRGGAVGGWSAVRPIVGYNDVWGNQGAAYNNIAEGEGAISQDPLFVEPDEGIFNLTEDSPCIDAGDPDLIPDGDGSRADMGCYPYRAGIWEEPPLEVEPEGLDFGEIATESDTHLVLTLRNLAQTELRVISAVHPPFRCESNTIEIESEGESELTVTFSKEEPGLALDTLNLIVFSRVQLNDTLAFYIPWGRALVPLCGRATRVGVEASEIPGNFKVLEVYPNPFNSTVNIKFGLLQPGFTEVSAWTLDGRLATIINAGWYGTGSYIREWHPDYQTSGLYLIKVHSQGMVWTALLHRIN